MCATAGRHMLAENSSLLGDKYVLTLSIIAALASLVISLDMSQPPLTT
jgi:hypothetical protein